jgi:lactoylglutathione lyase
MKSRQQEEPMITNVAAAVLYVGDQEEALAFYRDTLGFDVVTDSDMGGGARWIEVRPRGAQTSVVLSAAAAFGKAPGEGAYLTFAADDVAATVAELRSRGATVSGPFSEPWGTYATVDAPDGHHLQFHERPDR